MKKSICIKMSIKYIRMNITSQKQLLTIPVRFGKFGSEAFFLNLIIRFLFLSEILHGGPVIMN